MTISNITPLVVENVAVATQNFSSNYAGNTLLCANFGVIDQKCVYQLMANEISTSFMHNGISLILAVIIFSWLWNYTKKKKGLWKILDRFTLDQINNFYLKIMQYILISFCFFTITILWYSFY